VRASFWRAVTATVWVADREHTLVAAVNEATGEVKYFLTNATTAPLTRVLAVAFRRWTVEHAFRLGKQEAGLMDYEGRNYTGLVRHLILALVVLGFVATHTQRLRGEKPGGDGGTGVPGTEPAVRGRVPPAAGRATGPAHQRRHPIPPAAKRSGR
jgi:SRSO17 transposase